VSPTIPSDLGFYPICAGQRLCERESLETGDQIIVTDSGETGIVNVVGGEELREILKSPPKRPTPRPKQLKEGFYFVFHEGNNAKADLKLPAIANWVFDKLLVRLDFDNEIVVCQADIADELGIDRAEVSKAIRILIANGLLRKGGKVGRSWTYTLDDAYAWKGSVDNLETARTLRQKELQAKMRKRNWNRDPDAEEEQTPDNHPSSPVEDHVRLSELEAKLAKAEKARLAAENLQKTQQKMFNVQQKAIQDQLVELMEAQQVGAPPPNNVEVVEAIETDENQESLFE